MLKYSCSSKHFRYFCPQKPSQKYRLGSKLPQKDQSFSDWSFCAFGHLEGGFERPVQANSPVDCLPGRGFSAEKRIRPPRCFSFG